MFCLRRFVTRTDCRRAGQASCARVQQQCSTRQLPLVVLSQPAVYASLEGVGACTWGVATIITLRGQHGEGCPGDYRQLRVPVPTDVLGRIGRVHAYSAVLNALRAEERNGFLEFCETTEELST
jgi:hypothetical protein